MAGADRATDAKDRGGASAEDASGHRTTGAKDPGAPREGGASVESESADRPVEHDSAGVYFMSVEDFERRRPPSRGEPIEREAK